MSQYWHKKLMKRAPCIWKSVTLMLTVTPVTLPYMTWKLHLTEVEAMFLSISKFICVYVVVFLESIGVNQQCCILVHKTHLFVPL